MRHSNFARLAIMAGLCSSLALPAAAFAETWVNDDALTGTATEAPAQDEVKPTNGQYKYAKEELAAFCHFGPNTFSGVEWGTDYGTGKRPSATEYMKALESFDADTYVKMIKDAGFKRLIVTAKHHDGFCIWDSPSTDYDMGSTPRKIDILAELSRACSKYDVDMGLYLSPWDIHEPTYGNKDGDRDNYNDFYDGQLREILGNKKYGNKGKFVEVWMDGAKGTGADAQDYDFERFAKTIKDLEGDDCLLFQCGLQSEVRWVGNENGLAGDTAWNRVAMKKDWNPSSSEVPWDKNMRQDSTVGAQVSVGSETGDKWIMPEADARITSGWFWHEGAKAPKSLADLSNMYFNSVGHGAPLLLNVPPNNKGTVDPEIKQRTLEFGKNIKKSFDDDLTRASGDRKAADAKATSVWGDDKAYGADKVLDGDDATYWSAQDASGTQSLLIKFPEKRTFNVVSFEEAIQNGQRIKSFKVYCKAADGSWTEYGSGGTVGSKRLVRGAAITTDEVKIEFTTLSGKVAQISEVGVYKTTKPFEKPTPIPEGMKTIDNTGDGGMTTTGNWNAESNTSFINGTGMWTKQAGATASFEFNGTKFLLIGTLDPGHGKAKVFIDDATEPIVIDTHANKRSIGSVLYSSDTLKPGKHKVKVEVVGNENKAIGLDAAAVLDNGGTGMLDFDITQVTMDEDSTYKLGITRTGGSTGRIEVDVNFEPGSAVQGDFYTETKRVVFEAGETTKTVDVRTKRVENSSTIGDSQFYVTMSAISPSNLVIGTKDDVTVTIKDRETNYTLQKLKDALKAAEAATPNAGQYTAESVRAFDKALVTARAVAAQKDPGANAIFDAIKALEDARSGLKVRSSYSADDPFAFPSAIGSTSTIEFELGALKNDPTGDGDWPLEIQERADASMGKLVNSVSEKDTVSIPFTAERAGTYRAVLRYMSGSNSNKVVWSDGNASDPIIAQGEHAAGNANANEYKTVEFTFTVNKPGASTLVFTGPAEKSPRLDKLDITLQADSVTSYGAIGRAGIGGTIAPEGFTALKDGKATFTIAPDQGYRIATVTKGGEPVHVDDPAKPLVVEVNGSDAAKSDVVVEATFEKGEKPNPGPQAPTFTDVVPEATPHAEHIAWLAANGISSGWDNGDGTFSFRPYETVKRCDMAAFLYRLAGSPKVDASKAPGFADVDADTPHRDAVLWMAAEGISTGWGEGASREFRPYAEIARCDMAEFLYRMAGSPKADASKAIGFADVDADTPHRDAVLWMAAEGISTGWGEGSSREFRPYAQVARCDMAAFLHRMDEKGLVAQK